MKNYELQKGKLQQFGKFAGLKTFLADVSKGVDDKVFSGKQCSTLSERVKVHITVKENTKLNKAVGDVLREIKSNNQRHTLVENFLLCCDRDTVATEVPVWYWDKSNKGGVCGHIDIVQVKFGKIWMLDYKSNADRENVDCVVSQLYHDALGLSFRTGVGLYEVRCGWFDESKMFTFEPRGVKFG